MSWIKPLTLGKLEIPNNLIQAPLAGISCSAFRRLAHEIGEPGFCCTEMLSSKKITFQRQRKRYIHVSKQEGLLCFQFSGNQRHEVGEAVKASEKLGADIIDLNCGCPMKKIRTKGSGSKLLSQTKILGDFVETMRLNTDKPISIKIRTAGDRFDSCHKAVAKTAQEAGADFITVHGRHWQDDYDVSARLHQIAEVVDAVTIPVIGNGDVADFESMNRMFEETGCDGAMIARSSIGQPWLFAELKALDAGLDFERPNAELIGSYFLKHLEYLEELETPRQIVFQARRLAKHYARSLPLDNVVLQQINEIHDYAILRKWIKQTFT